MATRALNATIAAALLGLSGTSYGAGAAGDAVGASPGNETAPGASVGTPGMIVNPPTAPDLGSIPSAVGLPPGITNIGPPGVGGTSPSLGATTSGVGSPPAIEPMPPGAVVGTPPGAASPSVGGSAGVGASSIGTGSSIGSGSSGIDSSVGSPRFPGAIPPNRIGGGSIGPLIGEPSGTAGR